MTRYNCKFKYMFKNEVSAVVEIKDSFVTSEKFCTEWYKLPFGAVPDRNVTKETINIFFEEHCFPKHRADLENLLKLVGESEYDAFRICLKTEGRIINDPRWIEFVEE